MKLKGRQAVGGAFVVGGIAAYLWLMAAELVPASLELAAALGIPASAPVAWVGLTAAALATVAVVDRGLSRRRE